LVSRKIGRMNNQFKHKMPQATVDEIVKRCCRQWHQRILPEFQDNGQPWIVDYEMPAGFTAFKHGLVDFGSDEILSCFAPSANLIKKMLLCSVRRMRNFQTIQPSVSAKESSPPHPTTLDMVDSMCSSLGRTRDRGF
jgi:hypothetical protein